ncbi:MAG: acetyl-coenzyme A synthetase N-terminal domain-containing protein, partial [Actinomycetes bacterium]
MTDRALDHLLHENRIFPPSDEFAEQANATASLYREADLDRIDFWDEQAMHLEWAEPWTTTLDWSHAPFANWFSGGKLNVSVNCLDRHVHSGHGDQVAYYFEGEPGDARAVTYAELLREVSKAAHALTGLGVKSGDRVAIYLPMIPEAVISM